MSARRRFGWAQPVREEIPGAATSNYTDIDTALGTLEVCLLRKTL